MTSTAVINDLKCFHCGQACEDETLWLNEKPFCCYGCKTVYEILDSNNLCEYYDLDKNPGVQLKDVSDETYAYLNENDVLKKLLEFNSDTFAKVTFYIPAMHCISCIWLLENLRKLNKGILHSEVNFAKKSVTIDYNPQQSKLSTVAQLIASLGYAPKITLEDSEGVKKKTDLSLALKVGVAGFCFGNIMLFSFPEYLGLDHAEKDLMRIFSWLNLGLAIPAFFFSGFDYLKSAFNSFKQKQVNIDVPIAAGLIALFLRSAYDIITATGPGYLDSFTGLIFFLLIGRWFQSKTYESLAFDRDFTAYFPLAVNKIEQEVSKPTIIYKLRKGDCIQIRNMELIPADSTLLNDSAYIDYSFVTGEARPVKVKKGELIYAGGRLIGSPIKLLVNKATSQSHLTSLWNNEAFKKVEESKYQKIIDRAARKFTWIVLVIAFITAIYWQITVPSQMWLVLTSVLMVACPCALALAAPFTLGSMLRVFGKKQLYLKNADVIERMAAIDTVVFDKTGTVTHGNNPDITIVGDLTEGDLSRVKMLAGYSTHPLSVMIAKHIKHFSVEAVLDFKEVPGKGLEGVIGSRRFRIGSASFTGWHEKAKHNSYSQVYVSINEEPKGMFIIRTAIRKNIKDMLERLGDKCHSLLSGDNDTVREEMKNLFGSKVQLHFNQSPQEKLNYIQDLQRQGKKVMMIGDGLNDAGALKQSDVGIAITDDNGIFTPACDGILHGDKITSLDKMLQFAKSSSGILKTGFAISFFYNAIALTFAVTGHLTPLIAAIIMPISSISVVGFSTLAVKLAASRIKF
ncbi:heavy metal translocating P-type ATPase [Chryseosolibacter indicus]|uniref:Heavy metal translocating P-type ATPase n=1 Tax=Chryseosolibacter indicus TaxID=2782351 RepID=A0ABS5VQL3_9BACT|nr:heavy metal translocating P-type ATPase metal-binding domain-containing protein [Chryseosolibacter indicus]MBT1703737.1 heavy metal translocating P-type ATPase [Chryseosolibacter indicus]